MIEDQIFPISDCCPVCDHEFDAMGSTDDSEEAPVAGDVTICFGCTSILIMDINLQSRVATQEDFDAMPEDFLVDVQDLQKMIRNLDGSTQ